MKKLPTPKVITQTVTDVIITGVNHNFEDGTLEVNYMTLLDDGTPYQRGTNRLDNELDIADMYATINTAVAEGSTVRQAIDAIVTDQVIASI